MALHIRPFEAADTAALVEILSNNGQYDYPEVEGPESMKRAAACPAVVFLVAEEDSRPVALVRGIYDGARALIHLLSVHPDYQRRGIGRELVREINREFHRRGAPGAVVTATERSAEFWRKEGFARMPVFLMLTDFD